MKDKTNISPVDAMRRSAAQAEAMLKLLANANRLLILCAIVKGEKTVSELVETVGLSPSAVSQHLAKMRGLGLVEARKEGKQVYYHVCSPEVDAILSTLYLIYCR